MSELRLPEGLQGSWEHLLILTYGADLVFFEGALWRQLKESCRNRVILADGQQYLKACADYAHTGMVRHLNQRYVAEGIFPPRAAHAKLVLLADAERGRLLVGSGNLSLDGYAAGGELFTQYDFSPDAPESLGAFVAVRDLTELLKQRGYIGPVASERLDYLWEHVPWIFHPQLTGERPVRHNLATSFLEQVRQAVGREPVDELWILSPFYDSEAVALEKLLRALSPRLATILVQPGRTSVSRTALERVLHCLPGRCQVRLFRKGAEDPYVHAKLYLAKLREKAVCLQGSPNLSQVAMLLTDPYGNIEMANLLSGPRDGFDDLLAALDIEPALDDLEGIDLVVPGQSGPDDGAEEWRLIGGEWAEGTLRLRYRGPLPDLRGASLLIGGVTLAIEGYALERQRIALHLPPDTARLLDVLVPVSIRLGNDEDAVSNPIFPCNRAALDAVLQSVATGITPPSIRDLELDDDELSQLLAELDAALVIDRRSVWQLVGQTPPDTDDEDSDDALRIDYAEIDYERLRQHPRIQQYIRGGMGGGGYAQTRLQLVLNAITDHFQGLLDPAHALEAVAQAIAEVSKDSGQDEDAEGEVEAGGRGEPCGPRTLAQRTRRALKSFIRRYLRGIQSRDFREVAGFHVMANNYAIFSYLLWRLMAKDWVEPEFLVDAFLRMWTFFWGDCTHRAYFGELSEEEQADLVALAAEYRADAVLLAALYQGAVWTRSEGHEAQRLALRDFWRDLLCRPRAAMTPEVLERASLLAEQLNRYDPPLPSDMADSLALLAEFDTRRAFLRALESRHGYRDGTCAFEQVPVAARRQPVTVLVLRAADATPDLEAGLTLLGEWMGFEKLDYYRIAVPDADGKRWMLFYDVLRSEGVYWDRQPDGLPQDFGPVSAAHMEWQIALGRLRRLAAQADAEVAAVRARTNVA